MGGTGRCAGPSQGTGQADSVHHRPSRDPHTQGGAIGSRCVSASGSSFATKPLCSCFLYCSCNPHPFSVPTFRRLQHTNPLYSELCEAPPHSHPPIKKSPQRIHVASTLGAVKIKGAATYKCPLLCGPKVYIHGAAEHRVRVRSGCPGLCGARCGHCC